LVSIVLLADALERSRVLAGCDRCCADFRGGPLLLQVRREHLGCDNARFSEPGCVVFGASDRHVVVRGRLPCRVRLHANLHHRHTQRIANSRRSSTRCDPSGSSVAYRRCSRNRGEFSNVSDDRVAMDLHMAAIPWPTCLMPGIDRRAQRKYLRRSD
jgi:hypothetical protein